MRLDGKQIQEAIKQLIAEYKYDPYIVLDIVKMGVRTAYRKDYMPGERKAQIQVTIDADGTIHVYREWDVVDEIEDKEEDRQMLLKEAKEVKADAKVGDTLTIDITPDPLEFTRIGVQAAAQTIKQNLKNIERERFFEKFQDKEGELLKAKVLRVIGDSVVLDIDGATVVLGPEGQVPNRVYNSGEEIIVYLMQISKGSGGINLHITQSGPEFIEALLKRIVPEFEEGKVQIDKIVRITGKRTKMIVSSDDEKIDPVGVFVGHRGDRINTILSLLNGEKIDFIEDTGDEYRLVMDALKPARITSVKIENGTAIIELPEDQKALAIGKGAVNIKLASQLTGLRLELI
ncbi:MAG: transcription termination factor NusA [Candidatus Peribacteria bacterium]|nr:MAG: transcription termination factor NusA [Candidatus Peribacteria bacterium]